LEESYIKSVKLKDQMQNNSKFYKRQGFPKFIQIRVFWKINSIFETVQYTKQKCRRRTTSLRERDSTNSNSEVHSHLRFCPNFKPNLLIFSHFDFIVVMISFRRKTWEGEERKEAPSEEKQDESKSLFFIFT